MSLLSDPVDSSKTRVPIPLCFSRRAPGFVSLPKEIDLSWKAAVQILASSSSVNSFSSSDSSRRSWSRFPRWIPFPRFQGSGLHLKSRFRFRWTENLSRRRSVEIHPHLSLWSVVRRVVFRFPFLRSVSVFPVSSFGLEFSFHGRASVLIAENIILSVFRIPDPWGRN